MSIEGGGESVEERQPLKEGVRCREVSVVAKYLL